MDRKLSQGNSKYPSDPDLTEINKIRKRKQNPDLQEIASLREDVTKMFEELKSDQDKKFNLICDIIQEMREYRKEVLESNNKFEKILENTVSCCNELKKSVERISEEHSEAKNKISILEQQLEQVQRHQLASSLEILNIPRQDNENLEGIILKLHSSLGVNIAESDISQIHRNNSIKRKPVIVQYNNIKSRNEVLKAIKQYNKTNNQNKFNTTIINKDWEANPVFVFESLTAQTRRLYHLSRELQKNSNYRFCWITNGRVYLRRTEGSPALLIKSEQQLDNLKTNELIQPISASTNMFN